MTPAPRAVTGAVVADAAGPFLRIVLIAALIVGGGVLTPDGRRAALHERERHTVPLRLASSRW